jgi:hypothetical protein
MSSGVAVIGAEEVMLALRNLAKVVPDHARRTMHNVADKIVDLAKQQAPVDLHNLEDSIHKEVSYNDQRRLQIDIIAGGVVNGVDVGEYVTRIHEDYSSMNPGKGTIAKRAANPGVHVGEKFLERAYDFYERKLNKMMIEAVDVDRTL